jgi:Zn-dependent oligopeptidase
MLRMPRYRPVMSYAAGYYSYPWFAALAADAFAALQRRTPQPQALLRHNGLLTAA